MARLVPDAPTRSPVERTEIACYDLVKLAATTARCHVQPKFVRLWLVTRRRAPRRSFPRLRESESPLFGERKSSLQDSTSDSVIRWRKSRALNLSSGAANCQALRG